MVNIPSIAKILEEVSDWIGPKSEQHTFANRVGSRSEAA